MITPTIGRVVLVHRWFDGISDQAEPALICYVLNDRLINVGGFDKFGVPFCLQDLRLLQEDDKPMTPHGDWAEWMPYQKEQAARAEQEAGSGEPTE